MKPNFSSVIIFLSLLFAAISTSMNSMAQVKIGSNPSLINPNAILEMETNNKGLLMPRIALVAPYNPAPLSGFVNGIVVYNTATNDSVAPGLYYTEGAKWIRVNAAATPSTNNWGLYGNAGITAGNFLGTTDASALSFKTNNAERMRITPGGWIGIGTNTPLAAMHIKGQLIIDTLSTGNIATDSLLVSDPASGRVKAVSAAGLVAGARKKLDIVATAGQTIFSTPAAITDANKISLYRNGVMISFTVVTSTTIEAEIACAAGDEIRIIQLL